MDKFSDFYTNHKSIFVVAGILFLCILVYGIYPPIFTSIYQTGRDFGRSVVNSLMK